METTWFCKKCRKTVTSVYCNTCGRDEAGHFAPLPCRYCSTLATMRDEDGEPLCDGCAGVEPEEDDPLMDYPPRCTNPGGHKFVHTGTAYGGDDTSYFGEGRCYCAYCGLDGDG